MIKILKKSPPQTIPLKCLVKACFRDLQENEYYSLSRLMQHWAVEKLPRVLATGRTFSPCLRDVCGGPAAAWRVENPARVHEDVGSVPPSVG